MHSSQFRGSTREPGNTKSNLCNIRHGNDLARRLKVKMSNLFINITLNYYMLRVETMYTNWTRVCFTMGSCLLRSLSCLLCSFVESGGR